MILQPTIIGEKLPVLTNPGSAADLLAGKQLIDADGNVLTGTMPTQGAQTITPGTAVKTIAAGRYLTGTQTIQGDADLIAANIKSGVNIFGVTGTYEGTNIRYIVGAGGGNFGDGDNFQSAYMSELVKFNGETPSEFSIIFDDLGGTLGGDIAFAANRSGQNMVYYIYQNEAVVRKHGNYGELAYVSGGRIKFTQNVVKIYAKGYLMIAVFT